MTPLQVTEKDWQRWKEWQALCSTSHPERANTIMAVAGGAPRLIVRGEYMSLPCLSPLTGGGGNPWLMPGASLAAAVFSFHIYKTWWRHRSIYAQLFCDAASSSWLWVQIKISLVLLAWCWQRSDGMWLHFFFLGLRLETSHLFMTCYYQRAALPKEIGHLHVLKTHKFPWTIHLYRWCHHNQAYNKLQKKNR